MTPVRITRLHMGMAVLAASALHAGAALWLARVEPASPPDPPSPLRVTLIAPVAEEIVAASQPVSEPPPPQFVPEASPPSRPRPAPKPRPDPKPEPERKPEPKPVPAAQEREPEPPVRKNPVQAQIRPATPPAEITAAPPDAEAAAEYERLLAAWLEKHKEYPRRARRLRIEGEGRLRIVIDRTGRARQIELQQRTGNRLLDRAALEMARRADPFPPMPESDPRKELEFIVPVAFVLR